MKRTFDIKQIGKTLGVRPEEIVKILKDIIDNGEKFGLIDDSDMIFYQISHVEFDNLLAKFNNSRFNMSEGQEIFSKIIKDMKVNDKILKSLLSNLINKNKLKGVFNSDKSEFIALNVIYQTILRSLFNMGKIQPSEFAEEFKVPENLIRDGIVHLQTANKLRGIYINEGREYIIYETLKNEILNMIDGEFGISTSLIASQLHVPEEMVAKIIDDLLYDELIFVQSTPIGDQIQYITHRKISEEILAALKTTDRKNLMEIATRFNITMEKTQEILNDLIAQGRIIGYIDERANEFIQQSKTTISHVEESAPLNTILLVDNITIMAKKKIILENISFYVQKNQVLGIVGPSGTGKSTFLKAIIGQMPLTAGKITIAGYNTKDMGNISKIMGYVPQDLSTIYPNFTVMKNMEHFGKQYDLSLKEINKRAKKILKELKILDLMDEPVKNLSGGEKRRASIAISMIHQPKILFLDEPTSGLDPVLRKEFWRTITNLNEIYDMTLIVVTHYPDELQFVTKAVLFGKVDNAGKIIAIGTPKDLVSSLPGEGRVILVELKKPIKDGLSILRQATNLKTILEERKNEKFRIFSDLTMKEVVNSIVDHLKLSEIRNISQVEANMVDFFRLKIENQ